MARIASATDCPCETRTSTCRSLATASSGLCFLLAISVLLRFKAIPQGGPLRRGRITLRRAHLDCDDLHHLTPARGPNPAVARDLIAYRLLGMTGTGMLRGPLRPGEPPDRRRVPV